MPAYRDPGLVAFDAPIQANEGGGAYVVFPYDAVELFGVKGRVPVDATIDGVAYRGSIAPYGGVRMLGVVKELRAQIGKQPGDIVHVELRLDTAERTVDLDPATEASFAQAGVLDTFRAMSYSHQREYWRWIDEATKDETRRSRILSTIEKVREGKRPR